MSSLATLWAKFYHMEGCEMSFTRHDRLQAYRLRVWFEGCLFFDEIMDFCISCSIKKQEEKTKFELLKKLNIKYEHHIAE